MTADTSRCPRCRAQSRHFMAYGFCDSCMAYTGPLDRRKPFQQDAVLTLTGEPKDGAPNHRSVRGDDEHFVLVATTATWVLGLMVGSAAMLVPWYQRTEPWGMLAGLYLGGASVLASTFLKVRRRRRRGGASS